jgi:spore coat polysaccharide biosynthesis protein SpsF (cytidylyltransferase family)
MKMNILQILLIILVFGGCSSTNSLINRDPYLYTIEKSDGSKAKVKSHLTDSLTNKDYENLKNHLNYISNKEMDLNKKIIINFIDNDPWIHKKTIKFLGAYFTEIWKLI